MDRRNFLSRIGKAAIIAPISVPSIIKANEEEIQAFGIAGERPDDFDHRLLRTDDCAIAVRSNDQVFYMRGIPTATELSFPDPIPVHSYGSSEPTYVAPRQEIRVNVSAIVNPRDCWIVDERSAQKPRPVRLRDGRKIR